ncbi:hypothetical protein [Methanosphaera sp. BMS]|uniref:hypothetical protein n=1 Tax=Methanosphaera sp. BMS TaxID=1789762 RepID=UPI000DC1DC8B|nr:hypothetical protein [Methanosphaera sp. BMS]AWX32462.1 hypothetical protein AW729_04810 [Methanosphaera sp. BMS]
MKNITINNKRFELKYLNLINLIEKEDDKSKSYFNNSLLILTVESTLIISLLLNINWKMISYFHLIIILFNLLILFSINIGLKYFKKSIDNKDIITIEPSEETEKIKLRPEDYLTQINLDYEKNNYKNREILNDKRFANNQGIKFLRYGIIYLSFFLSYLLINVLL